MNEVRRLLRKAPTEVQVAVAISLILWILSQMLPAFWGVHEYFPDMPLEGQAVSSSPGWSLLLLGWAAPFYLLLGGAPVPIGGIIPPSSGLMFPATQFGASLALFAWYANPLWIWTIRGLVVGERPYRAIPIASVVLALSALQPTYLGAFDPHGVDSAIMPALGAYVWVVAICVPGLAAIFRVDRTASPLAGSESQPG